MAQIINLAQFDIDTRLIDDKIASNMQKINALKTTIGETKNSVKEYQNQISDSTKKINDNTQRQEDAAMAYNEGFLSQEAYNAVVRESSEAIRQEEQTLANLIQQERQQFAQLNSLQNEVQGLTAENRTLNRALRDGVTDLDQFENQMNQVEDQIEETSQEVNEARTDFTHLEDQIEDTTVEVEESRTAFQQLKDQLSETRQRANDLAAEMLDLEEAGEGTTEAYQELRQEWQRVSQEALGLHQQIDQINRSTRRPQNNERSPYEQLKDQLAEAREEANNLGSRLVLLAQNGQRDTAEYRELNSTWQESSRRARELHDELLAIERATGDNRRNVGNYADGIKEAFSGIGTGMAQIMSGNVLQGFDTLKESFKNLKDQAKELWAAILANPLLALAAALAAVGVGFYQGVKYIIEYNESIKENIKLTQDLTGYSGELADSIRLRAQAIVDTFGGEFKETLKTANTLSKQLGITFEVAFDAIEQGYIRGANASGDFLDRLGEYGPLLNKYGFDLDQIIGLQIQAQQQGLFGDKFEDSLKEAGLSLEEFTKAQSDAIGNAFGKPFADKLSHDVNSGVINVKDALVLMSAEAKKQGISVQQFGILTADVFKGAGEDVGGARVMFQNIYEGINKLDEPLTNIQQKTKELSDANLELAKAKDEALKSDGLMALQARYNLFVTEAETMFWRFVGALIDGVKWLDKVSGASEVVFELFNTGKEYINEVARFTNDMVAVLQDLLTVFGLNNSKANDFLKSILKFVNPLNLLKLLYQGLTVALKTFSTVIEASRVNISAFAITVRSVFAQIVDAANSFLRLDYKGGLGKLKNINISKEFSEARKEAERIVALNSKEKSKVVEPVRAKDEFLSSDNNKKTTQADRDAAAKAAQEAEKKAAADAKKAETKRIADAKKAAADAKKELEQAAKADLANAKERANQATQLIQAELAEYIAMNGEKLKSDKRLNQQRVNEITNYLNELTKKQVEANESEKKSKIDALNAEINSIKGKNAQEIEQKRLLEEQKNIIIKEYDTKEIQIVNENYEKQKELDKTFLEQKQETQNLARALEYQKRISDLESAGATELEIQKAQLNLETEQRLAAFLEENELKRELDQENYDINAEILAQRTEIETQIALEQDELKKLRLQNLLAALNLISKEYADKDVKISQDKEMAKWGLAASVANGMVKVAGEQTKAGKAMAVAEATISTIAGSVRALRDYPAPYSYILMGTTIAAGLAQVAKIAGVDTGGAESGLSGISSAISTYAPKKSTAKAANGMLIGPSHGNGGIPIKTPKGTIEAEGGEVIINKRSSAMYRDVLSQINQLGGGVKFATGGILGSMSSLPIVQNSIKQGLDLNAMQEMIVTAVLEGSTIGTQLGSQQGILGLSENRQIQNGAKF